MLDMYVTVGVADKAGQFGKKAGLGNHGFSVPGDSKNNQILDLGCSILPWCHFFWSLGLLGSGRWIMRNREGAALMPLQESIRRKEVALSDSEHLVLL